MKLFTMLVQVKKLSGKRIVAVALATAMLLGMATMASAATTVVHPDNMSGWTVASGPTAEGSFVTGPATPLAGTGSFRQVIGANGQDFQRIQTGVANGQPLTDLQIEYSTYVADNNGGQATYIQLQVDTTGDGAADDTLFFEPVYQNGTYGVTTSGLTVPNQCGSDPACVVVGTWQTWDADVGGWWSLDAATGGPPLTTLAAYAAAHPGATLASDSTPAFRLTSGGGATSWQNFDGNVDHVTINGDAYDFEMGATVVDCGKATDDIAAVQGAVNGASDGTVIKLRGTCDFSTAPAHGGDITSVASTAVLIRPGGDPIDGLIITSEGASQSATVLGSGTQAAFTVGPGNDDVTITGLRFVNVARAVVAINTDHTTVGDVTPETVPDPDANRIVGGATMDSAILGLAVDRGPSVSSPSGTITVGYGATGSTQNYAFTGQATGTLTNFTAGGNYVSYDPPGVPTGTTDVVAVDVRQRYERVVDGVLIHHNAVGMFGSEFPSINQNGVKVHSLTPNAQVSNPPAPTDYYIRDVRIEANNLGRLEELDDLPSGDVNAGDVHASGRLGIQVIGASNFSISGNGVRARMSPTGAVAMPGGGIVTSDSGFGRIEDNGIIVVADPSTLEYDLGAIGVVDELTGLFGSSPKGQPSTHVVVRGNIVGTVGSDTPALGAQRGLVLNGSSDVAVDGNTFKVTSDKAVNIAALVKGTSAQGTTTELPRTVVESAVCDNYLDSTTDKDDSEEVAFGPSAASVHNYFPGGAAHAGNAVCSAAPAPRGTSPADGARLKSSGVLAVTSRYDRDLNLAGSSFVLRDKTTTRVAGATALSGPNSVSGGKRSISFTPIEALNQLASPYTATVQAAAEGGGTTTTVFSFTIDDAPPVPPSIATPSENALTNAYPVTIVGTASADSTSVTVREGTTVLGTAPVNAGSWSLDAALADGIHAVNATASDIVGNESAASIPNRTFAVDATAPVAPAITTPAEGAFLDGPFTVAGTASENGAILIFDETEEGIEQIATATAEAGTWSVAELDLPDGLHTLTAKARDAAGNVSAPSAARALTVDTQIQAPTVAVSPNPVNAAGTVVAVHGTAEVGAEIDVAIDDDDLDDTDAVTGTGAADDDGNYSVGNLNVSSFGDGILTVTVLATDQAGNDESTSIPLGKDTVVPAAPSVEISPDPVNTGNQSTVVVEGTAEPNASVALSLAVGAAEHTASTTADASGNYTHTFDATPLPDGTLTASVRQTDGAGNQSAAASDTALKDTLSPGAPTIAGPSEGQEVNATPVTVTGTAEPGALVEVFENGNDPLGSVTANATTGAWSINAAISGDGDHAIRARQKDARGNQGTAFATRTFLLNTVAPSVVSTDPDDKELLPSVGSVAAIYSEALKSATLEVRNVANTLIAGSTAISEETITFTPLDGVFLQAGNPYTATTTGTDFGDSASTPYSWTFRVGEVPAGTVVLTDGDGYTNAAEAATQSVDADWAKATGGDVASARIWFSDAAGGIPPECGPYEVEPDGGRFLEAPCAGNLPQGEYFFRGVWRDADGNESAVVSDSSILDTAAAKPVISTPIAGSTSRNTSIPVSGTAEPGSTVVVKENGAEIGATTANESGNWSMTPTFGHGSHAIDVTAIDSAGNESAVESRTFSVDTSTPAAPVIATPSPNAHLNNTSVVVSGTADPNTTVTVRRSGSGTILFAVSVDGTGNWTKTHTFANGMHTINAMAKSEQNIEGPASFDRTFTVDTVAPSTPTIGSPTQGAALTSASVAISGFADPGSIVTVREHVGGTPTPIKTVTAGPSGSWSTNHSFDDDGTYAISAKAKDAAGNESTASATRSFTVDTETPNAPTIASPAPGATLSNATVTIAGTAESGATVLVSEGEATVAVEPANGSGAWTVEHTFTDGPHTISVKARDAAGNESAAATRTFTVDASKPTPPVIATPAEGATVDSPATISGSAEVGSIVTVRDGESGSFVGEATAGPTGAWSMSKAMTDGSHAINATARDAAGNVSDASADRSFTVDGTAPAEPTITKPEQSAIVITSSVKFEGTAEAGSTVTVRNDVDEASLGTTTVGPDGAWTLTVDMADGPHAVDAIATDALGNQSTPSAPRSFTVTPDRTAPAAPAILSPEEGSMHAAQVAVSGTAEAGATVEVFEGTQSKGTAVADAEGDWSLSATFATGDHAITAMATDAVGNKSGSSEAVHFEVDADAPAVAITTPSNTAFKPGDLVTIAGTASDAEGMDEVEVTFTDAVGVATTVAATYTPATGTWTATATGLLSGSYTVTATATDGVGNAQTSTSITIVVIAVPGLPSL